VKQNPPTPTASDILDSCSEACQAYDINFSSLLQQKSIEHHTPLYWAIIMCRPSTRAPDQDDGDDLITLLLSRSTPLISSTISAMRHACLLASDHALFERFKRCPSFWPLWGTDEMILGTSISPDTIDVEYVGGEDGKEDFVANFRILEFQKRMRVSDGVELEFIVKGNIILASGYLITDYIR
jgi:hypothetical protein